jgi:hypothetical protein
VKITVIIPSRGRRFQLLATIRTLQEAESGRHDVTYIVGCDSDDPATIGVCEMLRLGSPVGGPVTAHCFERTGSLGAMVNQMALDLPADVYCSLCDDVLVRTKDWDDRIADAWQAKPDGVWWWKTDEKRPATYAIVSEKWRAAAGRIFTDYFPFWWDDMWLLQTWMLAHEGAWLHVDAWLEDRPARTQRMRDNRFWAEFYLSRIDERISDALRIREALGWPTTLDIHEFARHLNKLSPEFMADADAMERRQGDADTPPTPEYLRAKARAEALMTERKAA